MSLVGLILVGCLALASPAAALAASPAKVQIEPAEQTPTGFKLKAKVNPEGSATTYYFIYKQAGEVECEDLEGCGLETPKGGPLTGDTQQEVQAEVTGLTPGTNYVYWLIARNAFSEDVRSASLGFTTPPAPSVETESVSYVTHNDATLEATINSKELPEGAYYQFQIVKNTSEYLPELTCPEPEVLPPSRPDDCTSPDSSPHTPGALPIGYIAKGPEGQSLSLDLATAGVTLQPSTTYHYRVLAAKRVQSEDGVNWQRPFVEGPDQTFTTLPPSTPPSEVLTGSAEPTPSGYKLNGKLNPDGLPTTYYYEYIGSNEVECLDIEPGLERCWHETAHVGPITGNTQQEVLPIEVTDLTVGVTYHYRLVASNADRTVFGNEASFTVTSKGAPSEVVTEPAEATPNGFRLKGKLNPDGLPTTYFYEYASDTCDEGCTPMKTAVVGPLTGDTQREVPAVEVTGLTARESWYRLVASNGDGTEGGAVVMFTTLPGGPSGQAKEEPKSEPPAPLVTPLAVTSPPIKTTTKPKSLTKAQKLANALNACESKPKKQRATCKRQARKKYSKTNYKIGKQASKRK